MFHIAHIWLIYIYITHKSYLEVHIIYRIKIEFWPINSEILKKAKILTKNPVCLYNIFINTLVNYERCGNFL